MFLLPGLVIGSYVSGMDFKQEEKLEMIRYVFNRAHPEDGGWGMWATCVIFAPSLALMLKPDISKDTPRYLVRRSIMRRCVYWECRQSIPSWSKLGVPFTNLVRQVGKQAWNFSQSSSKVEPLAVPHGVNFGFRS